MNLVRETMSSLDWEHALGIAGVGVVLLSLTALLLARGLRKSPAARDALLLSALAACLAVPVVPIVMILTGAPLVALPDNAAATTDRESPAERDDGTIAPADAIPPFDTARFDAMSPLWPRPEIDMNLTASAGRTSATGHDSKPIVAAPASRATILISHKTGTLIALVWLTGTFVLAGFAIRSFRKASRIRRRAVLSKTSRHQSIADTAAAMVGIRNPPRVFESTEIATPVVVGFVSPAVVLPPCVFETVSDDDLRDIFVHEFAHVRRRDQWVVCAQAAARCLYWPIATVHWLNREVGRSREEVCDNFVLVHHDAIAYGELLLRLAQVAMGARPIAGTTGILNWEGELEGRVVRILDPKSNRATATSRSARLLILATFLLAGGILCGTRFVAAEPGRKSSGKAAEAGPAVAPPARKRPTVDALGDPLPAGARLRLGTVRFHAPSGVPELALSPDESVVVTVGRQLIVWDAATGKERWRADAADFGCDFRGAAYGSRTIAFASDSSEFFTPGRGNSWIVWDISSGDHEIVTFEPAKKGVAAPEQGPRSIDGTPDGKKLAVGRADGIAVCDRQGNVLFEIANEAKQALKFDNNDRLTFFGHYSFGRFSPDGKTLAAVTSDRPAVIRVFDVEAGRELREVSLESRMVRLAFSPDGKQIAATERDSAVRLYDVDSGKRVWSQVIQLTAPNENYTSAVAYSPDGKTIAAGATDDRIYLMDSSTGQQKGRLEGAGWYPWALAFTANSKVLFSSGWGGAIRRWDVAAQKSLPLPAGVRATGVVAASPDGQWLAYGEDSGPIRLIAAEDATERRTIELPGAHYTHLKFSPDGRRLAGGGEIGDEVLVAVWNVASGDLLHRWDLPKGRETGATAESLCFTPDGNRLAAEVFRQSTAFVWDLTTDRQIAKLKHQGVYGLSFSPDGKTLATAGWDSTVRFWQTDTGEPVREFAIPPEPQRQGDLRMYAVCYAPQGGLIATSHLDGTVRVWQADTLQLRTEFHVEDRFTYGAIDFSPDGLWLATGSVSGHVQLWDARTGKQVGAGGRHQGHVFMVGFGRDSRTLVSGGGQDGVCYVWDLQSPGNDPPQDLARLWDDLSGDDGEAAYLAIGALSDAPDRAVALVAEKLRQIKLVVDPKQLPDEKYPEAAQRLERLNKRLAEKDPQVARAVTVRRAASLLSQIATADAKRVLEDLEKRDPAGELAQIATAALKRLRLLKT